MNDDTFAYREARQRFLLGLGCMVLVEQEDGSYMACGIKAEAVALGKQARCPAHDEELRAADAAHEASAAEFRAWVASLASGVAA